MPSLDLISSFFEISRTRQHGIASKLAQVSKTNVSNGKSAMLVRCGYKGIAHESILNAFGVYIYIYRMKEEKTI